MNFNKINSLRVSDTQEVGSAIVGTLNQLQESIDKSGFLEFKRGKIYKTQLKSSSNFRNMDVYVFVGNNDHIEVCDSLANALSNVDSLSPLA